MDLKFLQRSLSYDKEKLLQDIINRKEILYKTAFLYVKNEDDALEILDEAVYKACINIGKLKNPEFINTWLTRILINCAYDFLRHRKRVTPFENVEIKDESEDYSDLYEAVDALDGRYKTVIILKYFNGLKIKEISEVMDMTESSVKNILHKSLLKLRKDLGEEGYYAENL